ncbi:Lrp/AsnC family transcriptional regulator [Nonomuraea sp. NPDC026600]|uniref:Lrp/AsnC family transcriptional regulator n=1 Tax=Nonomuraea sp. NPDC026600 TaxID=3155363 RepID=UPI0033DA3808
MHYDTYVRNFHDMDAIDRAIIDELRRDARLSNTELAQRIRLTPAPCLRRVKRLEQEGVITGYHARVDPAAAGRPFEVTVSVEIRVNDQRTVEEFESSVAAWEEVVEVRRVFGSPDYILRVLVADVGEYERFQTAKLLRLDGVSRTISHQTMKLVKQEW